MNRNSRLCATVHGIEYDDITDASCLAHLGFHICIVVLSRPGRCRHDRPQFTPRRRRHTLSAKEKVSRPERPARFSSKSTICRLPFSSIGQRAYGQVAIANALGGITWNSRY
jgi:hypothetical protein